jgi:adenine-specific DNA-methyltransferase
MDKLNMQTTNMVDENIKKIGELFPNCLTETLDEKGRPQMSIDFDQLRQELSQNIVEGPEERYQFTWPDKRNAIRLANVPTTDTLRPCRKESVDFDNTKNLYIEGDNLGVLKLLRQNYLGKIKMIYIDPPYNTGKDFIYPDDFSTDKKEYINNSGQYDDAGNRMYEITESDGRYHTEWLNNIYPRLKVAKDLLCNDGVVFISIDDNEVSNLKKVCDEIFGPKSFIDIYNWAKTETPENLSVKSRQIIEYVLCYQKNKDEKKFRGIKKSSSSSNGLLNQPNPVGVLNFKANNVHTKIPDGIIPAGMYGTDAYDVELLNDVEVKDGLFVQDFALKAKFKWQQSYLDNEIKNGTIINIPTIKFSPSYDKTEYAPEVPTNLINSKVGVGTNENAGEYQLKLFDKKVFNFPKPVSLVKYLMGFNDNDNENFIILDFYSGSATSAEASMQYNFDLGENKVKFILVQIQEDLNKSLESSKSKSQKEIIQNAIDFLNSQKRPLNICELGKERIRRAGNKIKSENPLTTQDLDTGFRVLKLDSSNMNDVFYTPEAFTEKDLFEDNIKGDRTEEDLLFQVMIELGIELSAKIGKTSIAGKTVWSVNDGYLMACFDEGVNESTIKEVAQQKPFYFVMRDSSLATDNVADNFEQIWSEYSNDTVRKIL